MTPQQKALAQLLHTSLFKWADTSHKTLAELRKRLASRGTLTEQMDEELKQLGRDIEDIIDVTLEESLEGGVDPKSFDVINFHIVQMKRLL